MRAIPPTADRLLPARERLAMMLSPELISALEELVAETVRAELTAAVPTPGVASPWLSIIEGAEYLRISTRKLERLIARDRVRSMTVGRRRLLHRDDLDALARAAAGEDVAPTTSPRRREG